MEKHAAMTSVCYDCQRSRSGKKRRKSENLGLKVTPHPANIRKKKKKRSYDNPSKNARNDFSNQRFFSIQVIFLRPVLACQLLTFNTWQDKKKTVHIMGELQTFAQVNHAQSPIQFNLITVQGGSKIHLKSQVWENSEIIHPAWQADTRNSDRAQRTRAPLAPPAPPAPGTPRHTLHNQNKPNQPAWYDNDFCHSFCPEEKHNP